MEAAEAVAQLMAAVVPAGSKGGCYPRGGEQRGEGAR